MYQPCCTERLYGEAGCPGFNDYPIIRNSVTFQYSSKFCQVWYGFRDPVTPRVAGSMVEDRMPHGELLLYSPGRGACAEISSFSILHEQLPLPFCAASSSQGSLRSFSPRVIYAGWEREGHPRVVYGLLRSLWNATRISYGRNAGYPRSSNAGSLCTPCGG